MPGRVVKEPDFSIRSEEPELVGRYFRIAVIMRRTAASPSAAGTGDWQLNAFRTCASWLREQVLISARWHKPPGFVVQEQNAVVR